MVIYTEKNDDFVQSLLLIRGADSFINFHHKPAVEFFLKLGLRRREVPLKIQPNLLLTLSAFLYTRMGASSVAAKEFRLLNCYTIPEKVYLETGNCRPDLA